MTASIIDGIAISALIREEVGKRVLELKNHGVVPGLAVVLVGDDPASRIYVNSKGKACAEVGMHSETVLLPSDTSEEQLLSVVSHLNANRAIHGILCQLPVPPQIRTDHILQAIDPRKDVDGFHPLNVGKLVLGDPEAFKPATPYGVQQMLIRSGIETRGAHAVIIGRSHLVGRPLANLLSQSGIGGDATVTLAHSRTRNLAALTRTADIVVVAIGKAHFLTAEMIRPGATVIDVGINRIDDPAHPRGYRIVGDADFQPLLEVAGAITPVPGGVGKMTIAMLLMNTLQAARLRSE